MGQCPIESHGFIHENENMWYHKKGIDSPSGEKLANYGQT